MSACDPRDLQAAASAWRHARQHGDPQGWLGLYQHALAARVMIGRQDHDAAGALRVAGALIVARLARGGVLPAGFWPAEIGQRRASLLERIEGLGQACLLWPVPAAPWSGPAQPPDFEDLLLLDRQDPARWGRVALAADHLCLEPPAVLDAALAGDRPLRLHRRPWHWLAAVTAQGEARERLPAPDPGAGIEGDRTVHLCLLEARSWTAERVLAHAVRLACDDLEHVEQIKRWQRALLPATSRPELLVPRQSAQGERVREVA